MTASMSAKVSAPPGVTVFSAGATMLGFQGKDRVGSVYMSEITYGIGDVLFGNGKIVDEEFSDGVRRVVIEGDGVLTPYVFMRPQPTHLVKFRQEWTNAGGFYSLKTTYTYNDGNDPVLVAGVGTSAGTVVIDAPAGLTGTVNIQPG